MAASLVAVAGYAVQLGVPPRAVGQAALVGAVAWLLFRATTPPTGSVDAGVATLAATILIGAIGRVLARHFAAPTALWVVPAILPLLPGLQLVQAMLADTDAARIGGLAAAAGTAFVIGTGVAIGDIVIQITRGVRDRVVGPAVGAVAEGVEILVIVPVGRAVDRARHGPGSNASVGAGDGSPADRVGAVVTARVIRRFRRSWRLRSDATDPRRHRGRGSRAGSPPASPSTPAPG